ncbi:TetR/AcrR family transcriptional regulator [Streptomyces griseoaurantiacus]|uniref:TetR/AcrR family transcriptional regulator n=1 Tax=Streptomyces griseoaurantiacus TaxID=68213 RepID=UPI0030DE778B
MTKGSASAASDAGPNSRDLILDAARSLVTSQGYDGMSVSDLCARSGLPASSIYYHFGNKLGVLAALLDRTFQELHAQFPNPASFREGDPLDRFEAWVTTACASLDRRPDYLRLLLAVSVGRHKDTEMVRSTVRRIRDYAHTSWAEALTPVFAPDGGTENEELVDRLAVLGRAMTDGLAVTNSFDGLSYSAHVAPFVAMVRALAAETDRAVPVTSDAAGA